MTFRSSVAAAWFVVAAFVACAHAAVNATAPSVIHAPVEYPASAMSAGEEGTVLVMAKVDTSGRAVSAKIYRSSGYGDLDAAALRSIAVWSFTPATRDGRPVAQSIVVPIQFQLIHDTRAARLLGAWAASASILLRLLGFVIWGLGFVWSLVLGKRSSVFWLWGLVPLWILAYPVFLATHWSVARRNLAVILLGVALYGLGVYLAP